MWAAGRSVQRSQLSVNRGCWPSAESRTWGRAQQVPETWVPLFCCANPGTIRVCSKHLTVTRTMEVPAWGEVHSRCSGRLCIWKGLRVQRAQLLLQGCAYYLQSPQCAHSRYLLHKCRPLAFLGRFLGTVPGLGCYYCPVKLQAWHWAHVGCSGRGSHLCFCIKARGTTDDWHMVDASCGEYPRPC